MWWHKEKMNSRLPALRQRAALIRAVRAFFDARDFLEVDTPALQVSPGLEPHLKAMETRVFDPGGTGRTLYLHTSPEFAMKKLLAAGLPRIYQLCHVYRNAEGGALHSPEFTMLEWYRANAGYREIMADTEDMIRYVSDTSGVSAMRHGAHTADPFAEWEAITVCEAFAKYADFDLETALDDREALAAACREKNIHHAENDLWEDLFFRLFLALIEPKLGMGRPTILYDYPVSMAALSRPKAEDPRFAERFEVYICGIELANAFGELTDPDIQLERFEADMALKETLYGERYPVDPDFIAALRYGMPEAGGIALGIDRLAMLATGTGDLADILWCGRP